MTCIGSARILWVLNNLDPNLYYNSQSKYFINHFIESGIFESQNGFLWKLRIVPPSQNNKNEYMKNPSYSSNMKTLYYAAAIGEGCILVCNYGGEIGNGDYITSCPISGYGSLQKDDILHSYTVAKCTENIDWNSINETILCNGNGQLYKVYLASCTYHCG